MNKHHEHFKNVPRVMMCIRTQTQRAVWLSTLFKRTKYLKKWLWRIVRQKMTSSRLVASIEEQLSASRACSTEGERLSRQEGV